jgi:hypothetical protein
MRQAFVRAAEHDVVQRSAIDLAEDLVWEAVSTGVALETFASKVEPEAGSRSCLAVDDVS